MDQIRSRRLNLRLSEHEWEKAHRLCANSTCRSISEYARKLLTKQPIIQLFRNPSPEDLLSRIPPLLEFITAGAEIMSADPEFLETYGNAIELAEDIRIYLAKLAELCDPKLPLAATSPAPSPITSKK
jgi:hypothetical protein